MIPPITTVISARSTFTVPRTHSNVVREQRSRFMAADIEHSPAPCQHFRRDISVAVHRMSILEQFRIHAAPRRHGSPSAQSQQRQTETTSANRALGSFQTARACFHNQGGRGLSHSKAAQVARHLSRPRPRPAVDEAALHGPRACPVQVVAFLPSGPSAPRPAAEHSIRTPPLAGGPHGGLQLGAPPLAPCPLIPVVQPPAFAPRSPRSRSLGRALRNLDSGYHAAPEAVRHQASRCSAAASGRRTANGSP